MPSGSAHDTHNILISSAGRRGELVSIFRQSLADLQLKGQVFTIDHSPLTAAGALSDGLDLVPRVTDPGYVDEVLAICRRRRIRHLIPTIDPELPVYAASRDQFQETGVAVWVSDPETIGLATDKRSTNAWLSHQGLPRVTQWELNGVGHDRIPFPIIAKPARGSSAIGLKVIRAASDLVDLDRNLDYVLETVAAGEEYTVDVLVNSSGRCMAAVPRKRLEIRAGEVSKGLTRHDHRLVDLATTVAEALPGAFGVLNVQMFLSETDNQLAVIEINARFGGGFPLSWAAGCRMPSWLIEHLGGSDNPKSQLTWRDRHLMLRYDAGVYTSAAAP